MPFSPFSRFKTTWIFKSSSLAPWFCSETVKTGYSGLANRTVRFFQPCQIWSSTTPVRLSLRAPPSQICFSLTSAPPASPRLPPPERTASPPPPCLPFQIRLCPKPHVVLTVVRIPPVSLLPLLNMASAFLAMAPIGRLRTPRRLQMDSSGRHTTFWLGETDAQEILAPRCFGVA
jgi:hypothetical protein